MYTGSIKAPLVSIIVINFNYGRFIDQCLRSIAGQTYPHIECIVFDNASTDDSLAVLKAVGQTEAFATEGRTLTVMTSDKNLYQTPAAVKAFQRSSGAFVIFFDADDIMLPTCVEVHVRALLCLRTPVGASCVDYFISSGDHLVISSGSSGFSRAVTSEPATSAVWRRLNLPATGIGQDIALDHAELRLLDRTARDWPWSGTCGLCFRREMVEFLFRRTPRLKAQLDAYLIIGTNCLTGSVLIDRPLVIYRHHGDNVFAGGPRLVNLNFFDKSDLARHSEIVALELIETLTLLSKDLSRHLEWAGLFIEAIEIIGTIWSDLKPRLPVHSFRLGYIIENEKTLRTAFGDLEVDAWIKASIGDAEDAAFVRRRQVGAGHAQDGRLRRWILGRQA